jgi:hypothetical protein
VGTFFIIVGIWFVVVFGFLFGYFYLILKIVLPRTNLYKRMAKSMINQQHISDETQYNKVVAKLKRSTMRDYEAAELIEKLIILKHSEDTK